MTLDLFQEDASHKGKSKLTYRPLADRMRPQTLGDYVGQDHIIGEGKTLSQAIKNQPYIRWFSGGHPVREKQRWQKSLQILYRRILLAYRLFYLA